uniref:Mini-cistron protein n=1 Tax=Choristoneura fumiferana nuclear polyhedrosis virus TaxID=208973 RepID=Q80IG7_NPVCF|nr:mini-cistron protein [Choristoneura fumiferana multiple nucleopolyhedrovirus]
MDGGFAVTTPRT